MYIHIYIYIYTCKEGAEYQPGWSRRNGAELSATSERQTYMYMHLMIYIYIYMYIYHVYIYIYIYIHTYSRVGVGRRAGAEVRHGATSGVSCETS